MTVLVSLNTCGFFLESGHLNVKKTLDDLTHHLLALPSDCMDWKTVVGQNRLHWQGYTEIYIFTEPTPTPVHSIS